VNHGRGRYLAKVDTDGGTFESGVVKEFLGALGVKGGLVDDKDSVKGLDGSKVKDVTKGLCLGLEHEHGLLLEMGHLEVGDDEGVGG
jgi:hypothetical protein